MKASKAYIIQFVGLKEGEHNFSFDIDNTFFRNFEFEEFNTANVNINLNLIKKSTLMELFFSALGTVNVNCDLTNEPYDQVIQDNFKLVVKFGPAYNDDNDDLLIVPHGEYEINVAQYIYELVVLALPAKRVHPGVLNGTLQSDILSKLQELSPQEGNTQKETEDIDPRWNNLKKLLTDK